jgi:hypothetical protein
LRLRGNQGDPGIGALKLMRTLGQV